MVEVNYSTDKMIGREYVLDSFTFISLSYNQQNYIIEHLESIKQVINSYGSLLKIDYILADDCSSDGTVPKAEKWLDNNRNLFENILILRRKQNIGVVRNILDAVDHTKTKHFKILAADDRFECRDLFSLYDSIDGNMIITPVCPIDITGNVELKAAKNMRRNFNLICFLRTPKRIREILKCENFLPAPGIFFPGDFLRDDKFRQFLLHFRNIEDYPMFYYFLIYNESGVKILDKYYVDYRVGSGVSTSSNNEKTKAFQKELKELYKIMDIKLCRYPKYINPYKYYFKFIRSISNVWWKIKNRFSSGL